MKTVKLSFRILFQDKPQHVKLSGKGEVLFDTQLQHVKPSDKQEEDKRYDTKSLRPWTLTIEIWFHHFDNQ